MDRGSPSGVYVALQLLMPLLVLAFAGTFWLSISSMQFLSRVYPQVIIGILLVSVVVDLGLRLRRWSGDGLRAEVARSDDVSEPLEQVRRPIAIMVLTALFVWAVGIVGYFVALGPFVAMAMFALGVRKLRILVTTVGAFLLISYLAFSLALKVPLP